MSEIKKLTFDHEIALSDALVERYALRQRMRQEQGKSRGELDRSLMTEEEKNIWDAGDKASTILVQAYLPAIKKMARDVAREHRINATSNPSLDDLISAGYLAALEVSWSYNLRSGGGKTEPVPEPRRGKRFVTYASPHIIKMMKRVVFKEKTPFSLDAEAIKASWAYQATEERLREETGLQPTEEEIREEIHFKTDKVKIEPDLPMRGSFEDINMPVGARTTGASTSKKTVPTVSIKSDDEEYTEILIRVLYRVFEDKVFVSDIIDYLGLDSGFPRDHTELREVWDVTLRETMQRIDNIKFNINHPKYRILLYKEVVKENRKREIIGKGQ